MTLYTLWNGKCATSWVSHCAYPPPHGRLVGWRTDHLTRFPLSSVLAWLLELTLRVVDMTVRVCELDLTAPERGPTTYGA